MGTDTFYLRHHTICEVFEYIIFSNSSISEGIEHARSFLGLALCLCESEPQDVGRVIEAFRKVWGQLDALRA